MASLPVKSSSMIWILPNAITLRKKVPYQILILIRHHILEMLLSPGY